MTTPNKKREIHDMLSSKILQKRNAKKRACAHATEESSLPPTVSNFQSPVIHARSLNIQPVAEEQRNILALEGCPAVNSKSGEEVVNKGVRKPKVEKSIDATKGAIVNFTKNIKEPKRLKKSN